MELTKKTTITFPLELHENLMNQAKQQGTSLEELVWAACEEKYGNPATGLQTVEEAAELIARANERADREAEKAKVERERADREADHARHEAERADREVEKARREAKRADRESNRADHEKERAQELQDELERLRRQP